MKTNTVFSKILDAYDKGYRIISSTGGTRSGKTFSILQLLYLLAINNKLMISIVSQSVPHLKKGVIRDFQKIIEGEGFAGIDRTNKSDNIIYFTNGSYIEFFSADNPGKVHGSQRNILFINECNYIPAEIVNQLFVRTSKTIFLDYNPSNSFWIDNYRLRDDFYENRSTYLDNEFISEEQIREIESNKNNRRWWTVYGLGLFAAGDGVVFPEFEIINDNHEFINPTYGMDFGYIDPTTLVQVEIIGNKIFVNELLYKSRLSADEITPYLKTVKRNEVIIADNAEPQIINYLSKKGYAIKPTKKGPNSIIEGIKLISDYKIYVTKNSLNLINELRNYSWETDLNGNYLDKPVDKFNHAIDALRYAVTYLKSNKNTGKYVIR